MCWIVVDDVVFMGWEMYEMMVVGFKSFVNVLVDFVGVGLLCFIV